jgi:hypothetical protein
MSHTPHHNVLVRSGTCDVEVYLVVKTSFLLTLNGKIINPKYGKKALKWKVTLALSPGFSHFWIKSKSMVGNY